jgi:hypothetical protein
MVTGGPVIAAAGAAKPGIPVVGYIGLVIILSWALLFGVLLAYAAVVFTARGRAQRRRLSHRAAMPRRASQPAALDALRRADPGFDEQLLLDAAQTATMLVFAATSTGDETPISRLVTESFWQTPFGVLTRTTARDRRRENEQAAKDAAHGRRSSRWTIPLDYQASVPELIAVRLGARQQVVTVRVWFDQLQAVLRPGAGDFAAGAAATSIGSAMVSVGKAVAADHNSPRAGQANGVSWLAAGGRYDLTFVRPAVARTDPSAALADRTCTHCGATYMSELATACEHCRTPRPLPWGQWWLAEARPVT